MSTMTATHFLLSNICRKRRLLLEMASRDISDRYAGQMLGVIWAVIHPVLIIAVYIFLFAVVFGLKAQGRADIPGDHMLYMLSGLIPWLVIADVLGRSTTIVSNQASLVKQVVFPVEILPIKMALASLPTFLIGFSGLLLYALIVGRATPSLLLYPLAALPLYMMLFGIALALSAVGVFLRDTREIVQIYTLVGLYVAPIFYFMDWVPEQIRWCIYLNPVTIFIEMFHDAAYYGELRSWVIWFIAFVIGTSAIWLGAVIFAYLKPHFGSYL